ncbi:uncharacterized protein LOC128954406 [Oppia nitens]|uniref:uncharacterized protein LOC128954406 n=1 Tax=Oppia nitens TaxID=1686743 RepID=UPI0023DA51C4|nr:uncharacterized protein LOC128954406 [Oppia nitens]
MTTTTTMTANKDSFDRFGDDLAELLLKYLPIKDRLRLQSVSKQWSALIFNTQTDLIFDWKLLHKMSLDSRRDYYQTIKLFKLIVSKCPNITAVTISESSWYAPKHPDTDDMMKRIIDILIENCHRLRHFTIKLDYDGLWSVIDSTFERFFRQFGRQLLTFKFEGYNHEFNKQLFNKVDDSMPNLKTLDIITYDNFDGQECIVKLNDIFIDNKMCYSLPKSLKSLNIKLNESSMSLFVKFAEIFGKQLTSLKITFEQLMVDEDYYDYYYPNWNKWDLKPLSAGFEQMPRLRQLKFYLPIEFDTKFTGDLFSIIGRKCRQLKSLYYESYILTTVTIYRMFTSINKHMSKQLRLLSLKFSKYYYYEKETDLVLTSDLFNRLTGLIHLKLELYNYKLIGDQFFHDIHLNIPRLQSIHCNGLSITDESIQSIGQLAHLMDVYLRCDRNKLTTSESFISRHLLIDLIELIDEFCSDKTKI